MTNQSSLHAAPSPALLARLALAVITLALGLVPAAAAAMTDIAPAIAQEPSPCGDKPCGEVSPDVSPCGDRPCGEVPPDVSPCGDRPCGEVAPDVSPCGDKPCGEVSADVNPCGDKPCGEASPDDVNRANPDAAANPEGDQPATSTPNQEATTEGADQAERALDGDNTGSSSSGWILPLLFVALAAAALFWVVRRNRTAADTEV